MPAWILRVLAFAVSLGSMAGSTSYVLTHPKNPAAPLQPAVVDPVEGDEPDPTPLRRTSRPVTPTPTPRLTATSPATATALIAMPSGTVVAVTVTPPPTLPPTARPTSAPTARPTPLPTIQVSAAVRATSLPRITTTHRS